MTASSSARTAAFAYFHAKASVVAAGCEAEMAWQERAASDPVTDSRFMREAAWVILSSGMREMVVRRKFDELSDAFLSFRCAQHVLAEIEGCQRRALKVFAHRPKIEAIAVVCRGVALEGAVQLVREARSQGVETWTRFPYLGPVTALHLAKNLGLPVAKPDRHLLRIAALWKLTPDELCSRVASLTGDAVPVVDLVFWRYATLRNDYLRALDAFASATIPNLRGSTNRSQTSPL